MLHSHIKCIRSPFTIVRIAGCSTTTLQVPRPLLATKKDMLFSILILFLVSAGASAIVPRVPGAGSSEICRTSIYAKLAPLKYYAPAQSFCKKKYPNVVTIVDGKGRKVKRTVPKTTTQTTASTTKTTTRSATTTIARSTTSAKCTKDVLECLFSSVIGDGAKTVSRAGLWQHRVQSISPAPRRLCDCVSS